MGITKLNIIIYHLSLLSRCTANNPPTRAPFVPKLKQCCLFLQWAERRSTTTVDWKLQMILFTCPPLDRQEPTCRRWSSQQTSKRIRSCPLTRLQSRFLCTKMIFTTAVPVSQRRRTKRRRWVIEESFFNKSYLRTSLAWIRIVDRKWSLQQCCLVLIRYFFLFQEHVKGWPWQYNFIFEYFTQYTYLCTWRPLWRQSVW